MEDNELRELVVLFFEDADTGLLMLIPGMRAQMEVARFRLKDGLSGRGGKSGFMWQGQLLRQRAALRREQ